MVQRPTNYKPPPECIKAAGAIMGDSYSSGTLPLPGHVIVDSRALAAAMRKDPDTSRLIEGIQGHWGRSKKDFTTLRSQYRRTMGTLEGACGVISYLYRVELTGLSAYIGH